MNKILVFSSCQYSLKNKGDQAMLEGLINWLGKLEPVTSITAYEMAPGCLSSIDNIRHFPSPESFILGTFKQYGGTSIQALTARIKILCRGIGFITRFFLYKVSGTRLQKESHLTGFFHQILSADALIFSGGGYLNGIWWADGLYAKTFSALAARFTGLPVILTSQGLGPFPHPIDRLMAWLLFSSCSIIGVRDGEFSKATVNAISPRSAYRVITTGDDALLVPATSRQEIISLLQTEGVPETATHLIAVNLRDSSSYQSGYEKPSFAMAAAVLDEILERPGWHVIFVPVSYHSGDSDKESASRIQHHMRHPHRSTIINGEYSPSAIKGIIAQAQCSIGTSYHFLLFSLSQNIPALALYQDPYYQKKLQGLTSLYGQEQYCLCTKDIDKEKLLQSVQILVNQRDRISEALSAINHALESEFSEAHHIISDFISSR